MIRSALLLAVVLTAGLALPGAAGAADPNPPGVSLPALNLTAPQQQRLTAMENASRDKAGQLIGQIKQLRGKLSDLYGAYAFDAGEARRLNQELNHVQGQLLELHLSEQQQLRGILSPDQFTQLQTAIHQRDSWGDHHTGRHDATDHREGHGSPSGRFPY